TARSPLLSCSIQRVTDPADDIEAPPRSGLQRMNCGKRLYAEAGATAKGIVTRDFLATGEGYRIKSWRDLLGHCDVPGPKIEGGLAMTLNLFSVASWRTGSGGWLGFALAVCLGALVMRASQAFAEEVKGPTSSQFQSGGKAITVERFEPK